MNLQFLCFSAVLALKTFENHLKIGPGGAPGGPGGGPGGLAAAPGAPVLVSVWFMSNFQKSLKWLVLALPKSYSIFNKTVRCTEEFSI